MSLFVIMEFVGREKELLTLNKYLNDVKNGEGRVVLIEGPAGIGKTYLLKKFLSDVGDAQILRSRGELSNRYIPYYAFSQALGKYGSLKEIRKKEWKRRISKITNDIYKTSGVFFIDEIGYGGGYRIYKGLSKNIKGAYFTIRYTDRTDAIWMTETETKKEKINPYNIEFEFSSYIYDFLNVDEKRVIYIENLNYLVYIVGINRVIDFLHTVRSLTENRHIVIISGKMEYLSDEEKKLLMGIFDEKLLVEWEDNILPSTVIFVEDLVKSDVFKVSDRNITESEGIYVSPRGIHPSRLDFEIFERISEAIKNGKDVSIECMSTLIHYNDKRRLYVWLKAVRDYAMKYGRKVYIIYKPIMGKDMEFFLDLVDEGKELLYGDSQTLEHTAIRFYDVIYSFLYNYSRIKPVILVFEDVHWIDINSLELIHYLSRNIGDARIMIILTYRNEDIVENKNLVTVLTKIQGENFVNVLRLKPLGKIDLEKMLKDLGYTVDVDVIYEGSEGNPLLAINMARYIVEENGYCLPETIRESIELQIDRLDELNLNFVRFLSVYGNEIPLDIIKDFYPKYNLFLDKLGKLFVKKKGDLLYFTYSSYRDVIYRGISRDIRVDLHRKIGEWAERKNRIFLAAYHYYMGRDKKAIKFLKQAAEESVNMLAFKSAIEYLQKAVEIAKKYDDRKSMGELYESLGEWYIAVGKYEKAVDMFLKALDYYPEKQVYFGMKVGMSYRLMGEIDKADMVLQRYLEDAMGMDKARIVGELGIIAWETGDFSRALENLEIYLKSAKKYGSRIDEVKATRNIASVYYMEGRYKEALKYAKKALELAEDIGDIREIADTYNVIGVIFNHLSEYSEALKYLLKYLEISEKIGNMSYIARAYNNIGVTYEKMGDIKRAEEYHRKSIDIMEKLGNDRLLEIFYNNLGVLYSRHGDYLQGMEYLERSLEKSLKLNNKYGMCERYLSLGEVSAEMGKYFDSIDFYTKAIEIAREYGYETLLFSGYVYLARAYVFMNEYEKVEKYIDLAKNFKDKIQESYLLMDYYLTNAEYNISKRDMENGYKWIIKAKEEALRIKDLINILYIEMLEGYILCNKNRNLKESENLFEKVIKRYSELDYKRNIAEVYYYYGMCLSIFNKKKSMEMLYNAKKIYEEIRLDEKIKEIDKKISEI